jgi:hypothetical protein
MHEARERGAWIHPLYTIRTGGRPNRPLQQTKPRTILCALNHHACGFAAERQVVRRRHNHHEPNDEVMHGAPSESDVAELFCLARAQRARTEGAWAAGAPERRKRIAIDSSGFSPRACTGAGCASLATEITINSSGFRHAPARSLQCTKRRDRGAWVHSPETIRTCGRPNRPLQQTNAPSIVITS